MQSGTETARTDRRLSSTSGASLAAPLWILAALAFAFFLRETRQIFVPMAVAFLASYAVYPLFCRLCRLKVPQVIAAALIVAGILGVTGWAGWALKDDLVQAVRELPQQIRQIRLEFQEATQGGLLSRLREASRELQRTTGAIPAGPKGASAATAPDSGTALAEYLWQGSFGLAALAGQVTVFVFFLYFFLIGAERWRGRLTALAADALASRRVGVEVLDEINMQVRRFLLVRVLTTTIVGVATWIALLWFDAPAPALWAVAAGVLNWIPYFGPLIVSGGLAVVGFAASGLGMAAQLASVALAITTLEGWLITPPLLGRAAQLNTLAVLTSLLFWSWVWGGWGTILAVPITSIVKAVADQVESLQWLSRLLGNHR